jgi:topoisomerase-4 subunit A
MECDTVDTLLLFTSKGNYASLPVWQIEEGKWKDIGVHLNKFVRIDGDDKIRSALLIKSFDTYAWIVTLSSGGQIKKTPVSMFRVQKNSKVIPAMSISSRDELLTAFAVYEGQQIAVVSRDGFACRYSVDEIPSTGVRSKGVNAMNPGKGDSTAFACPLSSNDNMVVVISRTGGMKRLKKEEIPEGNRPLKGNLICRRLKTNPSEVIYMNRIMPGDSMIFTDPEKQILKATDIPIRAKDAGFSAPLVLKNGWRLHRGIEECRIIDIPENAEDDVHDDIEKISLFD